jgi:uncharacterized DUF497 family protein
MTRFDWHATKAATNIKKQGVSFDEAKSVFFDDFAVQFLIKITPKRKSNF